MISKLHPPLLLPTSRSWQTRLTASSLLSKPTSMLTPPQAYFHILFIQISVCFSFLISQYTNTSAMKLSNFQINGHVNAKYATITQHTFSSALLFENKNKAPTRQVVQDCSPICDDHSHPGKHPKQTVIFKYDVYMRSLACQGHIVQQNNTLKSMSQKPA